MKKKQRRPRKVTIKKVKLRPHEIVHVVVPVAAKPVVLSDPYKREVTVLAAPVSVKTKPQSWWKFLFGDLADG
jgi:hypothetical protein